MVGSGWFLITHDADDITILGDKRIPKHKGDIAEKFIGFLFFVRKCDLCFLDSMQSICIFHLNFFNKSW